MVYIFSVLVFFFCIYASQIHYFTRFFDLAIYNKIIFKGWDLVNNAARSSLDDAQRALLLLMSFVCRKLLLQQIKSSLY